MSASLQFRAGQHLTMTPFLQRSIQLLQLSSLEFQQEVQDVIGTNPFLETVEPDEPASDTDTADAAAEAAADHEDANERAERDTDRDTALDEMWSNGATDYRTNRGGDDDWDPALMVPGVETLREHLLLQAGCLRLSERDRAIVETLIESIDTSGYLTHSSEELCALCPPGCEADAEDIQVALRQVQSFDPPGVAARSVAECLRLQLLTPEHADQPARALALRIVDEHLGLLAAHDFQRLQRELGCEDRELQAATVLLRSLRPRPGAGFGADETQFVVADIIVHQVQGKWVAAINPEVIPKIQVNRFYASILRGGRDGGGTPVSQQMREARWLVRNIEQRFQTILRVAQAIVDHQSRYFDYGAMAMRPLTLGEIAAKVDLHESTVSRVTSRKYMATPRGLFEFKHFFGSHVETAAGNPCSATAVRALITELVGADEGERPLSDIKLTRLLEQRGIKVARRTVSKYRDALQIPSVEVRRMSYRPTL